MKFNYQGKKVSIYVGNLTWWTTDKDLQDAISALGVNDLIEIKFYENRANGQSKGFAVVHLASEASSRIIMDKLPGKEMHGQTPVVTPCNRQSLNQFEQQSKAQSGNSGGPPPQKPVSPPPQQLPPRPSISVAPFNPVHQPPPALPAAVSLAPPASTAVTSALLMPPRNRLVLPFPPPAVAGTRPPAILIPPTSVAIAPPASIPPPGMALPHGLLPPRVAMPPGMPGPPPPGMPSLIRGPGGVLIDPRVPPPRPMMPPISPNQPPPSIRPPHLGAPPLGPPPGFPPPPVSINPMIPPPVADLPPGHGPDSYRSERSQSPPLSDTEVEEIMNRNRAVSSSAISRAVSDASAGDYGSAIETLVTAISLIKQSKVATDERAKVLIGSLQDCLHGIEEKSFGSGSMRKRDRSRDRDERPRHRESKSRRRDRDRDRDRDRSRSRERYDDREYRERSRERDSGGYSSRHSDRDRHRR